LGAEVVEARLDARQPFFAAFGRELALPISQPADTSLTVPTLEGKRKAVVNRTDVTEFDFSAQIFLKPFEQEPTAAEQLTRSAALWLPWATASPITRTATKGRASVMLGQLNRCASSRPR
jgi:hypothetical protein